MSIVTDVSNVIGEHMLKGWVLTDSPCPQCKKIPLMRSPKIQTPVVHFCANCDGDSQKVAQPSSSPSLASISSVSHRNMISRSSTPATEISDTPGSPTFAIHADTPESRRRREQSDRASSEIGNRLLKGWALLGEECLNEDCFGIPLVRPPKSGGEKDPRRECVICGRIYVGEGELAEARLPHPSALESVSIPSSTNVYRTNLRVTESVKKTSRVPGGKSASVPVTSSNIETADLALNVTAHALEQTLQFLSERLTSSIGSSVILDPQTISSVVVNIRKTTQALAEVKKLQRTEMIGR